MISSEIIEKIKKSPHSTANTVKGNKKAVLQQPPMNYSITMCVIMSNLGGSIMKKEKPSTKQCKHCKSEIEYDAKVCPHCRKKQGKSGCLIIIIVVLILMVIGAMGGGDDTQSDENNVDNQPQQTQTVDTEKNDADTSNEQSSPPSTQEDTLTLGQKNALSMAKRYLDYTAFSYSGLIEQLEYEGYSTEEATYAVDNCGADWNEQAALKAQDYLDYASFSRSGLIDQLLFEGFTSEQAEYGVTAVGY